MKSNNLTTEIIKSFFTNGIIQIKTNPMFKLTSGKESPVYIDHRKIFSHSALRKQVTEAWASMLKTEFPDLFTQDNLVFAGVATAGIVPAFALAEYFNTGFIYVRPKPKEYGMLSLVEGNLPKNSIVVVVDDMVTTGGSVLKAVENLQTENVNIHSATSISRHDFKNTQSHFAKNNVILKSLFETKYIFEIAYEEKLITADEAKLIKNWLTELDEQQKHT